MKKRLVKLLFAILCMALASALYAYFSSKWAGDAPDYLMMAGIFAPWLILTALLLRPEGETRAWSREKTRRLVICAMLTALGVVLGGLLNIPAMPLGVYSLKIGFGALPVILAGVLFGPGYGAMVGGITDFLQALLFPKGAYVPFFTIVGTFFGLIPGLFFANGQEPKFGRILLAVATGQLVASVVLNTLLLIWLYSMPWETFIPRIINQAVMIPVYSLLVYSSMRLIKQSGFAPRGL